jgi:hypothetical protein
MLSVLMADSGVLCTLACCKARVAHNLVFLGSPAEGFAPQLHQELTVGCGEGFLGKAKNNR